MGAIFTFITWAYSLIRGKQVQIATTENKPAVSPMKAATTLSWSAILLNGATRLGPSMSMVYRNSLSVLGIGDVAIKVASTKDLVRGLRQEKAILVALQGVEGVPEVLGSFKDENERAYYLLIKWIEGWTLDEMLGVKSLSMLEGLEVIKRVAVVVRSVHERNVIHRDIKPGNIIVGFNNEVTLIDFNLGLYCCEEVSNTDRMGTPLFCAPEQRIQYAALSRATDIYGLGQTINMMLQRITHKGMYYVDNPVASQDQQQLLPLDLVEPGFVYEHKLISAMTAINPAERPDINTVIAWLEGLIEARKH